MPHSSQALHISDEQSTPQQVATERNAAIANGTPVPLARPLPANDPLAPLKAMTEEEKIALFT